MEKNIIEKVDLKNGLTLEIIDRSKKIAADRYYVGIHIRIEVSIDKKWFAEGEISDEKLNCYKELLGETIVFEQKKERNFVEESAKDEVIESLCKSILDHTLIYFNHKDFAKKLILKKADDASASFKGRDQ